MSDSSRQGNRPRSHLSCGFHAVESVLARSPEIIEQVLFDARRSDKRAVRLKQSLNDKSVAVRLAERKEMDQLSGGVSHQGVVAVLRQQSSPQAQSLPQILAQIDHPPLLLVLDQVKDPHNLGACLRSADGAGVDVVLLPKDRACPVNETVRRVAAGAAERVQVIYAANLARSLQEIKEQGVWLVGCADQAEQSIYDVDLSSGVAMILGAEESGLRQLTRKHCDYLVQIPMAGSVSSLNVSVATGVVLFEAVRQRLA